ncbi:hypothetical protein [Burkholderia gladioli]|uniref:hypothetical protein n=1 Tax=Burkholderia gladioli TaxID=28095 RepID=UPI000649FC65|nr:hypothetical protein [Burkholderia gladioli]
MHSNTKPFERMTGVAPLAERPVNPAAHLLVAPTLHTAAHLDADERAEAAAAIDTAIDSVGVVLEAALAAMTTLGQVRAMLVRGEEGPGGAAATPR